MTDLAKWAVDRMWRVVIYSNRRMLTRQTSRVFAQSGITTGVMAAGHHPALLRDVQIASIQTINSRVFKRELWNLHEANLVIIDEAHQNKAAMAQKIIARHRDMGATIVGFTATPLGVGHIYDKLVVAGTNSELRACGALVPCTTFAPDEPDLTKIRRNASGEFVEEEVVRRVMLPGMDTGTPRIFGRVREHWPKLNPERKPTLLFAPDVPSSRFFAQWFTEQGIPAAHIDGETPDDERERIAAASLEGSVQIVCNRFVLREGVDWPWIAHAIFATAFGAVGTYIQAGGRALRAFPGLDRVIIQDHGGNWHRPGFGSLNDDRQWSLEDTNASLYQTGKKSLERGEPEPLRCPRCDALNRPGKAFVESGCWNCGYKYKRSVRMVIQTDGTLKRQVGRVIKPKRQVPEPERIARNLFFMAANSKNITVGGLDRMHYNKTGRGFPDGVVKVRGRPVSLPGSGSIDWDRRVRDVFPEAIRNRRAK